MYYFEVVFYFLPWWTLEFTACRSASVSSSLCVLAHSPAALHPRSPSTGAPPHEPINLPAASITVENILVPVSRNTFSHAGYGHCAFMFSPFSLFLFLVYHIPHLFPVLLQLGRVVFCFQARCITCCFIWWSVKQPMMGRGGAVLSFTLESAIGALSVQMFHPVFSLSQLFIQVFWFWFLLSLL